MNREVSALASVKPKVSKNVANREYQARGACFRPYSDLLSRQTISGRLDSVLTGGVRPMALKDCASAAWSHPPGQVGCWLGGAGGVQNGANRGAAAASMAAGWG